MKLFVRLGCWTTCMLMLLVVGGCSGEGGPKTVKVRGKITKAGAPISVPAGGWGNVEFIELKDGNMGERLYPATINPDGTYENDIAPGKYRITVLVLDKPGGTDTFNRQYDSAHSTIDKEVTAGANDFDISLGDK